VALPADDPIVGHGRGAFTNPLRPHATTSHATARLRAACVALCAGALLTVGPSLTAGPAAAATPRDPSFSPAAQRAAAVSWAALSGAAFTADDLITDVNFGAVDSLDQAAVQNFLAAQTGVLDTYQAADHLGVKRSAAAIVVQAAHAWGVSPKVILATLQKEQGLLSAPKPSASALAWAMGCGCPDSGSRATVYEGFGNQIWYGAAARRSDGQAWHAGIAKACGDGTVKPADKASYALYTYTPWIGLAGGGNKLFWTLYHQYFGDPLAIDATAPVTTVTGADAAWHPKAVSLTFKAVDNAGGTGVAATQYKLGAGAWTKAAKLAFPAPVNHSGDGVHVVSYRSVDDAGNQEKAGTCTVKIDTTAATTTVAGADAGWHDKAQTLTFAALDAGGSGVACTQYVLDTGAWTKAATLTLPAPADHSDDGAHSVAYRALDKAGNLAPSQSCTVRIDTRRPQPFAAAATVTSGHTAKLLYRIRDARPGSPTADATIRVLDSAGHLVRKLKAKAVPVNTRLAVTFVCHLAAGQYRIVIYAVDAAGNAQTSVGSSTLTVH
jgi:hypothetical protein